MLFGSNGLWNVKNISHLEYRKVISFVLNHSLFLAFNAFFFIYFIPPLLSLFIFSFSPSIGEKREGKGENRRNNNNNKSEFLYFEPHLRKETFGTEAS